MYGQLRGRTISLCKRQVASQRRVAGLVGPVASSRLYVSLPRRCGSNQVVQYSYC